MRIAYDPQIFYNQRYGGISRYFVELANAIHLLNHDTAIFAPAGHNEYLEKSNAATFPASLLAHGMDKLPPRFRPRQSPFQIPIIAWEIRQRIGRWKPDVVHETYYTGRPLGPKGTPVVVTVYDMIHELFPEYFPEFEWTRYLKAKAVERAEAIICISHSTANDLVSLLNVPREKIFVTHLAGPPANHDAGHSVRPGRPFFLYVGSRGLYKNFTGFLNEFAACPDLRADFDIIAFGGGGFSPEERESIAALGLTQNVSHQQGDDERLSVLYKTAHLFVYPSLYEGFGLPPLEAMAQACPVVACATSSIPEVVGHAGVLFDPSLPGSMAHALHQVAYDEALRSRLVSLGYEQLDCFSWKRCADETLNAYRSVVRT